MQCINWLDITFQYFNLFVIKRFTHGWTVKITNEGWFTRLTGTFEKSLMNLCSLRNGLTTLVVISWYACAVEKLARRWLDIRLEEKKNERRSRCKVGVTENEAKELQPRQRFCWRAKGCRDERGCKRWWRRWLKSDGHRRVEEGKSERWVESAREREGGNCDSGVVVVRG